jgi:NAD dependent epimerase/dehydratase family enzyme
MAASRRIVIAGGSGFIGRALATRLAQRAEAVVILTRSPRRSSAASPIREVYWDGRTMGPWTSEVDGAHGVINLTGKNVNCRYTPKNLAEIDASREDSVRVMAAAINGCARPPRVLVQASTTAIFDRRCRRWSPDGPRPDAATACRWT